MIESRKEDHIDICLEEDVEIEKDYWSMIKTHHRAAPEVDLQDVSLETEFLDKELKAPLMIAAMTGGFKGARRINETLASLCQEFQIPLGVGSQRAALEDQELRSTYQDVKDYDIPLVMGNIGAPQLIEQGGDKAMGVAECRDAMSMVGAHYLAVHFNYLQEVVQPEGDTRAKGLLDSLKNIADELPVIAKETGAGISSDTALELQDAGVKAIDVGGKGGTSFSAVEYFRNEKDSAKELADLLWDWGIPTPVSIIECRRAVDIPVVGTGGIRNGLQMAKAIALGADIVGIAGGILPALKKGEDEARDYIERRMNELKTVMFLLGCENVSDLKEKKMILTGELVEWL